VICDRTHWLPALVGLALTLGACGGKPPPDWVARLASLAGTVEIVPSSGAAAEPAKPRRYLRVGSLLRTGADSTAVLELRNGGSLTVKPGSVVQFASEAPERQLRVGLKSGAVIGKASQVQASELVIGIGARSVRLASEAAAEVTSKAREEDSSIVVTFGNAEVEGPDGKRKVVEGQTFTFTPPSKPDAVPATRPATRPVEAKELVFFLQASGKGRVMIRRPGERKLVPIRKGEAVRIAAGTEVVVAKGASVSLGTEKGKGTTVSGPAELKVVEGPADADGKKSLSLESSGGTMQISSSGEAGKAAAPFVADGVKVTPRVTYKRLEVKVRKERGRTQISVNAGEALLEGGKGKKLRLEAGQEAFLQKGSINGPHMPPAAPMEVKSPGAMRVFTSSASIPVSFRWGAGTKGALVEIGKSSSMDHPLFSDVIQRTALTVPQLPRGTHYWRVRKIGANGEPEGKGSEGKLLLVKDTSYRSLKDRQAPKNVIHESFGNTTVYYQNILPRFTFRWETMDSGAKYQMKIFREQSLSKPVFTADTTGNELSVPTGKLGEGTYIWYVAGRGSDGALIRTTKSRKLAIKYDNATPDLQIVYPQNGISVGDATLETKGVTIPGSKVSINGTRAELDETYRFTHVVKLKAGVNHIVYLVTDPRRGASYYLRQVTRQ
jgi:ferric-dicitrate binding protein FerR (iron transport regulator)